MSEGLSAAEYTEIVEQVMAHCRGDEHAKRVWLIAEKLRREGW